LCALHKVEALKKEQNMSTKRNHPETIALHGGDYRSDPATNAVAVPIYRTTSYPFKDTDQAANLFALKEFGNIYTRIMNPTNDVLREKSSSLRRWIGLFNCSRRDKQHQLLQFLNVAQSGDNIVSSTDLYGGTVALFTHTLKKLGIEVRYADPADPKNFEKAIDDKTRAFYAETLPNPYLRVFPIQEVAEIGKKYNIPLIVDNTAAPVICKPIEHGAAVVSSFFDQIYSRPWNSSRWKYS
jgi:O-acetylhomoserine (thiol)-lyase